MALPATRLPLSDHNSDPASRAGDDLEASLRHVTACVDGSAMDAAVLWHAGAVASALELPLTLLHVVEPEEHGAPPDPIDWDVRRREADAYVRQAAAQLGGATRLEPHVELRQGHAAEQIRQWALAQPGDLAVFCRHGEHGPCGWALSSTARKIAEGTMGSLLVVPSGAAEANRDTRAYERILVPLDGSLVAESALSSAVILARAHQAELIVVHIVPGPQLTMIGPPTVHDRTLEQQVTDRNQRVAEAYLQRIHSDLYDSGLRVRLLIRDGGDVRERLESLVAEQQADLVVLSSHGQTTGPATFCGSVAAHLLTHVDVPLLVLREGHTATGEAWSSTQASADAARHPLRAG